MPAAPLTRSLHQPLRFSPKSTTTTFWRAGAQPATITARDLAVSKHGSPPKKALVAGMVHSVLPRHALSTFYTHENSKMNE